MLAYRIELTPDDNGALLVTCPALPEVTTFVEDADDAPIVACEAIEEALGARMARNEALPPGDARDDEGVRLPLLTELKAELYRACREQGVIRAELARRLEWNRESVDRLFRLDHASRLQQIEAAFRAIGLAVRVSLVGADGDHRAHA